MDANASATGNAKVNAEYLTPPVVVVVVVFVVVVVVVVVVVAAGGGFVVRRFRSQTFWNSWTWSRCKDCPRMLSITHALLAQTHRR